MRSPRTCAPLFVALLPALISVACAGTTGESVEGVPAADREAQEAADQGPSTRPSSAPADCATMLPPSGLAAQMLMLSIDDPLNASELVSAGTVGGFLLDEGQRTDVGERITEATADAPLPVTVAVDEEGGSVQRLRNALGKLPSAEEMAEDSPAEAAAIYGEHATAMAELGINMNFAPVADVGSGSGLDDRVFGDDPVQVGGYVTEVVASQELAGITPVLKHWPGIGSGDDDPDDSLTTLDPIAELRAADLLPFERAIEAGAPAVLVTHAEVPGLTAEGEPASLSAAAIGGELRDREGFGGVVIADDMGADSIEVDQAEAAETAIRAGADMVIVSGAQAAEEAHDRLVGAIEEGDLDEGLVEESVRRVLRMKGLEGECFDAVSAYSEATRLENERLTEGTGVEGSSTTTTAPER